MSKIILGVGDAGTAIAENDELKTFALGSCVALIFLDPKVKVAGMVHIALPESKIDPVKAESLPGYFADTGIPYLLQLMGKVGSTTRDKYIIKMAGGANVLNTEGDLFQIGKRNVTAIKKILWDLKMPINAEDVGENFSRTVSVELKTGKVYISSADNRIWRL